MNQPSIAKYLYLLTTCLAAESIFADSYPIIVGPQQKELAAYSFSSSTISNAIPWVPNGTQVSVWNVSSQSYSTTTFDTLNGGWYPSINLNTGDGFWIQNNQSSNLVVNVYGTPVSAGTFSMTFSDTNKWYLVGSAYPLSLGNNFLECMGRRYATNYPYVTNSLNYWAHQGDIAMVWSTFSQSFVSYTRGIDTNGLPLWSGLADHSSPRIVLDWPYNGSIVGKGFFLRPALSTNYWVHLKALPGSRPTCP